MRRLTLAEFQAACRAQASRVELITVKCPMCGTLQNARDFIAAGAGKDFEAVSQHLGFHCVGRLGGAGAPRSQPDGEPCNWTLGGHLRMHTLEILTPDGKAHPHFELAGQEEAHKHCAAQVFAEPLQSERG